MTMNSPDPYRPPEARLAEAGLDGFASAPAKKVPNKRVCAFIADFYLISILNSLFSVLAAYVGSVAIQTVGWIVAAVYLLFRDGLGGRSVGKRLVGLKVVDRSGQPCTAFRSFIRNILLLIMLLLPAALIIEYIALRVSKLEQRIGDRLAGTCVMDLRPDTADGLFLVFSILLIVLGSLVIAFVYVPTADMFGFGRE